MSPELASVKNIGKPCAGKSHARFDEGGLASQPWRSYLGTARRKGRKQISSPKADNASSLLYPDFFAFFHAFSICSFVTMQYILFDRPINRRCPFMSGCFSIFLTNHLDETRQPRTINQIRRDCSPLLPIPASMIFLCKQDRNPALWFPV